MGRGDGEAEALLTKKPLSPSSRSGSNIFPRQLEQRGGGGSQADHREEEGGGTIMQKRGRRGEGGKKLRTNISRKRRKKGDQVGMKMENFTCSAGGDVVVGTDKSRENL